METRRRAVQCPPHLYVAGVGIAFDSHPCLALLRVRVRVRVHSAERKRREPTTRTMRRSRSA